MIEKTCLSCNKVFQVYRCREHTAKACSKKCLGKLSKKNHNMQCTVCGTSFYRKPSHIASSHGNFCSTKCHGHYKAKLFTGVNNPNYRGREHDYDGYAVKNFTENIGLGLSRVKTHRANAMLSLGVSSIPVGYHVHHRDCDRLNNSPDNLALLTISDHVWLHKQYGRATLSAFMRGKIPFNEIVSWSDDKERAAKLLLVDVISQGVILGIIDGDIDHKVKFCSINTPIKVEFIMQ